MEQPQLQWPRLWRVGTSTDVRWVIDEEWGAEAGNMAISGKPSLLYRDSFLNFCSLWFAALRVPCPPCGSGIMP